MKKELPKITEAEWKVMKVFWDGGQATLSEAVARLAPSTGWKPRTVQSLIRRLVEKGAIEVRERNPREFQYFPAVSRDQCQLDEGRSFLGKVFDGRMVPFVAGMVENEELSPDEIEELRQLLDQAASRLDEKES